jgi:hypothetical protein
MLNVVMLSVTIFISYAECYFAECRRYAECHYATCRGAITYAFLLSVFVQFYCFEVPK